MKNRILAASKIHESALKKAKEFAEVDVKLDPSEDELVRIIGDYDAIMVRSKPTVTRRVIEAAKKLKVIGRAGVGLDNVDVDAARQRGVVVVNSPEASSISVAEHTFALILSLLRHIPKADRTMREGKWEKKLVGNELYGKRLGIIGFGRIGKEVALRAGAFGMTVVAHDPAMTSEDIREYNATLVDLGELLRTSDIVSLHVPALPSTRDLINAKTISLMKPTSFLINASRGHAIDEEALCAAIRDRRIAGAALDVYKKEPLENSPLLNLENVVLTPHLGANTDEAQINAGTVIVEKIRHILSK